MKHFIFPVLLLAALAIPAQSQTTQPDEGPPVPAEMAPTYLHIGKDLIMRVQLVHRALDELQLDPAIHKQADQMVDNVITEMTGLMSQVQSGKMPPNQRVVSMPQKLMQNRQQLIALLGPDQAARLQEKIESIRGEARLQIGRLRIMVDDLALPKDKGDKTAEVLAQADTKANALPDTPQQFDDESKSRDAMNHLLADAHDGLAAILSAEQQSQLGPKFSQLALAPATQP